MPASRAALIADDPRFDELIAWCASVDTRQLHVRQAGAVLLDRHFDGGAATDTFDIASVQKPVTSVVLGQLLHDGVLALDDSVSRYLGPGWTRADPEHEAKITIEHLASMTSGLDDRFVPYAAPGERWYYNNFGYHQLRKIFERVVDASSQEIFAARVFEPLGMVSSHWVERPKVLDPAGWPLSGLKSNAHEIAVFGQAVLADDPSICRTGYRDKMISQASPTNPLFGYLWWRFGPDAGTVPGLAKGGEPAPHQAFGGVSLDRRLAASAPSDMYGGMGAGNQRLYIVPSQDLVVVRLRELSAPPTGLDGPFDEAFWSRFPTN